MNFPERCKSIPLISILLIMPVVSIFLTPSSVEAQTPVSKAPAESDKTRCKSLADPGFVWKWTFDSDGDFDGARPLRGAAVFTVSDGMLNIKSRSQRSSIDFYGPFDTAEIDSIEIRIRCIEGEKTVPPAEGNGTGTNGASGRVKIHPQIHQGARLYWTKSIVDKFDAKFSIEVHMGCDGDFTILSIDPRTHTKWNGIVGKIRLDAGDFPNHFDIDYVYFRKIPKKTGKIPGTVLKL